MSFRMHLTVKRTQEKRPELNLKVFLEDILTGTIHFFDFITIYKTALVHQDF